MKPNLITILGIILILLGVLGLLGVGIPTQETVMEAGPIEASVREEQTIPMVVAGVLLVLGLGMAFIGQRRG